MKRKFLGMFLCCVMVFCLLPTETLADDEPTLYDLWVNGEQFISENLTSACGVGAVTYDPGTNTLTLDNAEITGALENITPDEELKRGPYVAGIFYSGTDDLTIHLIGTNTVTVPEGEDDNAGIYAFDTDHGPYPELVITGDTLFVYGGDAIGSYGIYASGKLTNYAEITVVGGKTTAHISIGIFASEDLTNNGVITAKGGDGLSS